MTPPKTNQFFLILILGSCPAIGPFSIDMYLPGFPAIAADLGTTVAKVTLPFSSFSYFYAARDAPAHDRRDGRLRPGEFYRSHDL